MEKSQKYCHFFGADECNNGGVENRPEVMVVAYSQNPRHLKRMRFSKGRLDRIILDRPAFTGVRDYRIGLIQRENIARLGSDLAKAATIALLVDAFGKEIDSERSLLCFDGEYGRYFKDYIADFLKICGRNLPKNHIHYERDADEKYHLVNRADEIAYHLYRMYALDPNSINKYNDRRVDIGPNLNAKLTRLTRETELMHIVTS